MILNSAVVSPAPLNAFFPIVLTFAGIVIVVREVQSWNAESPIFVTLSGIIIRARELQPLNAAVPIFVTLSGIVIVLRAEHPQNIPSGNWVIVAFKFTFSRDVQFWKT